MNFEGLIKGTTLRTDREEFKIGDTVKVYHKIVEGSRERVQLFNGIVISIKGSGINKNFTVRRMAFGEGMEKIFPYHSPRVEKIEVVKKGKVRRAKLYYLRSKVGKKARVKELEQIFGAEALAAPANGQEAAAPAASAPNA